MSSVEMQAVDAGDQADRDGFDESLEQTDSCSLQVDLYCAIKEGPNEAGSAATVDILDAALYSPEPGQAPAGMSLAQGAQVAGAAGEEPPAASRDGAPAPFLATPPPSSSGKRPRPPLRQPSREQLDGTAPPKAAGAPAARAAGTEGPRSPRSPRGPAPPGEPPYRLAAQQQARARPQDKAAWAGGTYAFLAGVPDRAGLPEHLRGDNLEAALAQRVAAAQPVRAGALPGHTDVVIQDMVNATVREIVGTVESLLDRLLLEKKQDTLRNMVAELMTAELSSTLAAGREQLRSREFARIDSELERLSVEVQRSTAHWEDRFQVTRDLRDSHDSLGSKLDERLAGLEARLASAEGGCVPRAEFDAQLAKSAHEAEELSGLVTRVEEQLSQLSRSVAGLRVSERAVDGTVSHAAIAEAEDRMASSLAKLEQETRQRLEELHDRAATAERVAEVRAAVDAAAGAAQAGLAEVRGELDGLSGALQRERLRADAALEQQGEQRGALEGLRRQAEAREQKLREELGALSAAAATRQELERERAAGQEGLGALRAALEAASAQLQRNEAGLRQLETLSQTSLATREYAYETARSLAYNAAQESDEKGLIEQLRREFEEERERSRQTVRQVQVCRRDLSDMIEIFHETRERCGDLGKTCGRLAQQVEDLDGREAEHWTQAQAAVSRHGQAQEQLEAFHRALREEFVSHTELQRNEAEKMRTHSTQRYLEQMEKALDIQKSLENVTVGHKELSEAVRSVKLPKVLAEQPGGRPAIC